MTGVQTCALPIYNVFSSLRQLQVLILSRNQIGYISPDAFNGLVELRELSLHTNALQELDGSIFRMLANLQNISLQNNRLRQLPGNLFANVNDLLTIQLQNNQLENLPLGIFDHLGKLCELRLYDNPWRCDSDILPLHNWLLLNKARLGTDSLPVCFSPASVRGQSLIIINVNVVVPSVQGPVVPSSPETPTYPDTSSYPDTTSISSTTDFTSPSEDYTDLTTINITKSRDQGVMTPAQSGLAIAAIVIGIIALACSLAACICCCCCKKRSHAVLMQMKAPNEC